MGEAHVGQTLNVSIIHDCTGNSCWGTVTVESKQAPVIEDCDCPAGGSVVTSFNGSLSTADGFDTALAFNPGAGCVTVDQGAGNLYYDTYEFSIIDASGSQPTCDIEFEVTNAGGIDSYVYLYEGSFNPEDLCENLIALDDDGGAGVFSLLSTSQVPNNMTNYVMVFTSTGFGGSPTTGGYDIEITPSDSNCEVVSVTEECKFRCIDIAYIHNSTALTPNPTASACGGVDGLVYADELITVGCGTTKIIRTWVASNEWGSTSCTQEFLFDPINIGALMLPKSPVMMSCNSGTSPEDIEAYFEERNEGFINAYPTYMVNGHPQKVDNNVCDIYAGYTDQELEVCEEGCNGNRKVIRTWTLVDWCTLETTTYIQVIKAVDTDAPTLATADITVSTPAWGCEGDFEVPAPWELHDNCDDAPKYRVTGPAGTDISGSMATGFIAKGTPKGTHPFTYIAYDCCGNEASYPFYVTIEDHTPPVVVAKQNVVISLTSSATSEDGMAKLYAGSIDNGSYDGCSDEVRLEIRRATDACMVTGNTTYNNDGHPNDAFDDIEDGGAYVKFCCEDVTNAVVDVNGDEELDAGYVEVWLRVWDDGDMNGVYGTSGDNYNEAWAYVKVEDKLAPVIVCPPSKTIYCDEDYTDLDVTGRANAFGSCGDKEVLYSDEEVINGCNIGFVKRTWYIVGQDDPEVKCVQTIIISEIPNSPDPVVSFNGVGDKTAKGCPSTFDFGIPTWSNVGACDVLGYTLDTDTFEFEEGACLKLVNHWTVINWCDYAPNDPNWNGGGIWEHTQIIKVTDETVPVFDVCRDTMYAINDHGDIDNDDDVCEAKLTLEKVATDPGTDNCPTGWLKWQVNVDLWGDGVVDLEYSSFLPTNHPLYLKPTKSGDTLKVDLPDIGGSMSNHKVVWKVTDGCNNVTTCVENFMVKDLKAPTPYMIDISSAVMESSCTVELWASDFNIGSFDNCTAQENLTYEFEDGEPNHVFTGQDVLDSPVTVRVYVVDEKGNKDYAMVSLTLVDNNGCVDPPPADGACECTPTDYTGWAVGTCNSEHDDDGAVGVIFDTRNTVGAPKGTDWGTSITTIHPSNWTIDQIGQVFGIALDEDENVYLAASDVYDTGFTSDPYGAGQIFKASASNDFLAEPFVELPNSGGALNGIGNIVFCNTTNMLYASNLEDGMIYRINPSGTVMETYDPWTSDDGGAGIAPASEQVWGLGLNIENDVKKLYFPRVGGGERAMYSISLNENGSFPSAGSEKLEFDGIMGVGMRITDIAFDSGSTQMVFAERGTKFTTGAHDSRVMRYDLSGGSWSGTMKYNVGGDVSDDFDGFDAIVAGENSAGGVSFGSVNTGSTIEGCDEIVWGSMNYYETVEHNANGDEGLYYGIQGMNANGNADNSNDLVIDYNGEYTTFDEKGDIGDVELFRCGGSTSSRASIAGNMRTEQGEMIAEVQTGLMSNLPEYPQTVMAEEGIYIFENQPINVAYEVSAKKTGDWLNGVSTLDLVKIQRHILGLEQLDSPYKLIAADINGDEAVKANDLSQLRKLILGVIAELPTNKSWRFVDAAQEFSDATNPWPIDETIETGMLVHDMIDQDFIGVKIGDVSGNAIPGLQKGLSSTVRSNKTLDLEIAEQEVTKGETVEVTFMSENFAEVYGYQFTMELKGLEFVSVQSGAVTMTEANVGVLKGDVVTVSYSNSAATTAGSVEGVFTMTLVATEDGKISNMLDVTSKVTQSEAYVGQALEVRELTISTRGGEEMETASSELYQNEPNPFREATVIGFELAEAGQATLKVTDVTGRVLVRNSIEGQRGYNEVTIKTSEIGTSGVLYYTIESGEFTATKKMIIVR